MPTEELVKSIDRQYALTPDVRHLLLAQLFRDELVRREQEQATAAMLKYTAEVHDLTRQMRNLTWVILGATLLSLAASVCALVARS